MNTSQKCRFAWAVAGLSLAALVLLVGYGVLTLGGSRSAAKMEAAERGPIVDRNGRFLALQARFADITVNKSKIQNIDTLSAELSQILDMPASAVKSRIENSSYKNVIFKNGAGESAVEKIKAARDAKKLQEVSAKLVWDRIYPESGLASQIIGFVGGDNRKGMGGIEFEFEAELAGTPEGRKGSTVVLTIDANVQYILEQISAKTMAETRAESVMFLAMDPRSGEILGMASLPNYNPNEAGAAGKDSMRIRPMIDAYEPGSVFKIFSLASLLEAGAVADNSLFLCNGRYERTSSRGERWEITCLDPHGWVRPREIILHSCNVGIAQASEYLEKQGLYDYLQNFGFGEKVNLLDNLYENPGILRPLDKWSDRTKATLAIGQETAVSAMQILKAASAIANDGVMVSPRLVSRLVAADGKSAEYREGSPRRRVISVETARAMRSYMAGVTSSIGTGWRANVEDLSLAVKTGTAQYTNPGTRGYSKNDFVASCIALLPAESPSLVLYQVIIKPQGETYGGRIAAPAIRDAAEALIDYLGIPRGRNMQVTHPASINIPGAVTPVIGATVPSFYGLAKRTILPLLLRDDIAVEIRGEGWVRRQAPPPGTPITAGTVIILELE